MLFKSQLVTQVSGSVGGMTGSHNKGGLYFRARSIPVNPGSSFQTEVRNAMATLVNRWTTILTEVQRVAWSVFAQNVSAVNRLADVISLSGQQQYLRSNIPRIQAGLAVVDDGPTVFSNGSFDAPVSVYSEGAVSLDVEYNDTEAWVGEDGSAMLCYSSRGQNVSINYFKGPYRLAGVVLGNATTPPTSPEVFSPPPFPATEALKYFSFYRVSRSDGRLSGKISISAVSGS